MNRKKMIIISITGITIVLLALIGLTYAYFLTQITGNEKDKSISLNTTKLSLVYGSDNGSIIGDGEVIIPGTTFDTKTFTVTNNGTAKVDNYAVILDNVKVYYTNEFMKDGKKIEANTPTEFERPQDFELKIECKRKDGTDCHDKDEVINLPIMQSEIKKGVQYITNGILVTNSIEKGDTHTYKVTVTYKNEEEIDQSADMNKTLEGRFNIIDANNTIAITGKVDNYNIGDIVQTNSTPRISQINSDGTYKIVGLEEGVHTVKLVGEETTTEIGKFSITKGDSAGIGKTTINGVEVPEIIITDLASEATLNINEGNILELKEIIEDIPFQKGTLGYNIYKNGAHILNANTNELEIDKSYEEKTQITKVSDGTDMTDVGIFTAPDDYGTSYYYRGPIKNNYVNFAGFMWRIVRINGDGTIRLILDGTLDKTCVEYNTDNTCKKYASETTSTFNSSNKDNAYVGYMYGFTGGKTNKCLTKDTITKKYTLDSSTTYTTKETCENAGGRWAGTPYETTHINKNSSIIKTNIDTFYETYIENGTTKQYEKYLADTMFCGDKSLADSSIGYNNKTTGYGTGSDNRTYYAAAERLIYSSGTTSITTANPTLKCASGETNTYSRYTKEEQNRNNVLTNGDLKHPIALLSADELVFAGAFNSKKNQAYYLYDAYTNGTLYKYWWLLTPCSLEGSNGAYVMGSFSDGSIFSHYAVGWDGDAIGARPVINLRSDVLVESGDGTSGSGAYKVSLPNQ